MAIVLNKALIFNIQEKPAMRVSVLTKLSLLAALLIAPLASQADDWGCTVMLCMSAPNTPPECGPTLSRLARHLAKGRSFPSCAMIDGNDGGAGGANSPKFVHGVAAWVPKYRECVKPVYKRVRDGNEWYRRFSHCDQEVVKGGYFDHHNSCSAIFPARNKAAHDFRQKLRLREQCQAKSKRWTRVEGAGIDAPYKYH